jgi:hypothetical protein
MEQDNHSNEVSTEVATEASTAPETTTETVEAPAYEPNLKFKVYDQELEVDEIFRPLVTSKEAEEKVKDYLTKAHGLDVMKEKYGKTKERLSEYETKTKTAEQAFKQIASMRDANLLGPLFDNLGIKKENVLELVKTWVQAETLPAHEQQRIAREQELAYQNYAYQQQMENQQQFMVTQAVISRQQELDGNLSTPEVSQFAQAYDARVGRVGAFKEEVVRRGQLAYHTQGVDLSARDAIHSTIDAYKAFVVSGQTNTNQTAMNVPYGQPTNQAPKPSLPTSRTSGAGPVKKNITSIQDLRNLYQSRE